MTPDQGVLIGSRTCRECGAALPEYPGVGRPRTLCDDHYPSRAPRRVTRRSHEVPAARRTDPETSHQAAASVNGEAVEQRILAEFALFGALTDDELADLLPDCHAPTVKAARSRLSKSVPPSLVSTGMTRPSNRGRPMLVWEMA